jgi:hypothetical protein
MTEPYGDEVRVYEVEATDIASARRAALSASWGDRFDALQTISTTHLGVVRIDEADIVHRYRVEVRGYALTESEARMLGGDR